MVCKVKIHDVVHEPGRGHDLDHRDVDLGIEFINNTNGDKTYGMPPGKNDWGTVVTASGCGDDYAVYVYEHSTDRNQGQNAMVIQDGRYSLHRLAGGVSAVGIDRVTKPDRAVGFQDIHWLSDFTIKNGTHRMFHHGYEIKPGVWLEQTDVCPNGKVIPVGMHNEFAWRNSYRHRFACSYPKTEAAIRLAENGTSGKPTRPMYEDMINRLCSKKENLGFRLPNNTICAEHSGGVGLAKNYCLEGENLVTNKNVCNKEKLPGGSATYNEILKTYCSRGANIKSSLCSELSKNEKGASSAYETLWRNYCDRTPGDSWCACYNAVKDASSGFCGSNPTAAGCVKVKQNYGKLVEKTPSDQKAVWSGMQPCFGGVCSASDTFKPEGYNASCDKTVSVCIQDIDVQGLKESQINATCEINQGKDSPPSVKDPSSSDSSSSDSSSGGSSSGGSSSDDKPPEDKTKMYIGIGVGALIFIILLVVLLGGDDYNNNYNNF